jgi:hypothetical protein
MYPLVSNCPFADKSAFRSASEGVIQLGIQFMPQLVVFSGKLIRYGADFQYSIGSPALTHDSNRINHRRMLKVSRFKRS